MGDKLLVRSYNVGCGDCIYVGIPNGDDRFHILIDCGSKEGESSGLLRRAVKHMEENLLSAVPEQTWKRLDLLVVTHQHEDHIKGFDPEYFENIQIDNIWVSAGMNEAHSQSEKSRALHQRASLTVNALFASGAQLSPELEEIYNLYSIDNERAKNAVLKDLPDANNIETVFVHAGMNSDELGLEIADTTITVLAPEQDIDGYYLGEEASDVLRALNDDTQSAMQTNLTTQGTLALPTNISAKDFDVLRSRMLSNALAFVAGDTKIQNNVSTVLLIQWRGRRLLFVGDAEWAGKFKQGKKNGSWNVMWETRRQLLNEPIDFLKVGHHGSHNATPWHRHADEQHEVNQIFNAILPLPLAGESPLAQAVVSTKRKQYKTIPDPELLVELGRRTSNTRNYAEYLDDIVENFDPTTDIHNYSVVKRYSSEPTVREVGDKGWLDQPQPMRTDFESSNRGDINLPDVVGFVDIELNPQ